MWTENVFVTRPGHSVSPFWFFFQDLRGLPCLQLTQACQNQHYRSKPSWDFLADSDATFDIGGNWNVDWKWSSWVSQAMQFPRFEGFFFKMPEVFLVHNFHKPAKTSIIVPKPYSFLVESDATFDIGGRIEMWTENRPRESARPCCFPVLKGFFQGPRGLPCLQLPQACQNQHYRTKTL